MKAKYPKAVWVGFDGEMNPINVVCDKRNYRLCYKLACYHLHPGNEVRLKRENAMMRRLIKTQNEYINLAKDELNEITPIAYTHGWRSIRFKQGKTMRSRIAEIRAAMPGLFKAKRRGSK